MQNKILIVAAALFLPSITGLAQNVGVNTQNPTKELSVTGSIVVDHENTSTGDEESQGIYFGTGPKATAIMAPKTPGSENEDGLSFWTNNIPRLFIGKYGEVGINTSNFSGYDLSVAGPIKSYGLSTTYQTASSNISAGSSIRINGNQYYNSRLTVNGGDSYLDGNVEVIGSLNAYEDSKFFKDLMVVGELKSNVYIYSPTARTQDMSIGGVIDPAYRLRAYSGNSRFGGDVQVTGALNTNSLNANSISTGSISASSINGKGVVRSNGNSSLRIGFDVGFVNQNIPAGGVVDVTIAIAEFSGDNDDARVFISQFVTDPLPQYANWHKCTFHVHSVDPSNDTCKIRIANNTGASVQIKGNIYIASIAKN